MPSCPTPRTSAPSLPAVGGARPKPRRQRITSPSWPARRGGRGTSNREEPSRAGAGQR